MTPLGKRSLWLRPPAPKYIESWVDQLPRNQINETENKQQRRLACAGLDRPMRRHPDMKHKKKRSPPLERQLTVKGNGPPVLFASTIDR